MFEEFLEDIAQKNGLREVNTYLKLVTGLGAIILCLLSSSFFPPLFIALLLTGSILILARVDAKTYAGLFIVPFWFALFSVAGIILVSGGQEVFWRWDPMPSFSLSITRESINQGFLVFCRVIGGMSAMCFIALTTPMTDIFIVLRQCRIPEVVIDLAMIIYRTIFIIVDQVQQIYNAQVMRLGYSTFRESIYSFASMCGAVFIASWNAGEDLIKAMDARCYDGKFALLGETRPVGTYTIVCNNGVFVLVIGGRDYLKRYDNYIGNKSMSSIILEARGIRYRYPRSMEAIRGISFHVRKGEKIALVGPNGAGKSTLLMMFNGMIRPDAGTILFDSQPIRYDTASLRMLRKRVGFVLQNPDRQIIAPTVYQDVAFGPTNLGYPESEVKKAVALALSHVGLEGFDRRPPHQLSGGEKKRVAIAGVLAMDPDVLVFDEPTSGLDPSGSEDIMELLDELNHGGKTVIISTHDVELAYPWADRAILLLEGKILQEDIPEVAFGNPECVRMAHLSVPLLLELYTELQKRGFSLLEKKPQTVLDMMHILETLFQNTCYRNRPGTITVCNVDLDNDELFLEWISSRPGISVGAMGTRAKQRAENRQIRLDFTYGVIDKCILKALLGDDSLILTTGSMVDRVQKRVDDYGKESGIHITVTPLEPGNVTTTKGSGSRI